MTKKNNAITPEEFIEVALSMAVNEESERKISRRLNKERRVISSRKLEIKGIKDGIK